uniref:Uncharacterized protein n=1 Tax=Anguilla anguilla TaxID=7936 RepID=A0A0E9TLX3_ANGAN
MVPSPLLPGQHSGMFSQHSALIPLF